MLSEAKSRLCGMSLTAADGNSLDQDIRLSEAKSLSAGMSHTCADNSIDQDL